MTQSRFKIGDKVKVTDSGCIYPAYSDMARIMGITNWGKGSELLCGDTGTVINIQEHLALQHVLIGIRTDEGKEHIIGEDGLESVKETKTSDVIKISRKHLNEYYDHSNTEQRNFINNNFTVDGTTTIGAIIKLERIASDFLKPVIRKNHPEYFSKPEFDFSKYVNKCNYDILTTEQFKLLGFNKSPIQIRSCNEYRNKAFYLNNDEIEWKLIKEGNAQILLPIKK